MSERGKKVNKHNPANRAARKDAARLKREGKVELDRQRAEGIAPRTPIEVKLGGGSSNAKCESCGVDLSGPETKHNARKHKVKSGPNKGVKIDFDPSTGRPKEDIQPYTMPKAEDLGKTGQARAARGVKASIARLDEKDIAEARREKTPSEQAAADAAAAGTTVEDLAAVREGRASFIDQKPKPESKFEPVNLAVDDVDQPKGSWTPSTKTGIFTPAPTGAVRGNRAQPLSPAVQENTVDRVKSGMGLPGMQEDAPSEIINHPVHGEMEVPASIARAHRLYDLDFQKNSGKANRLAGLQGSEDYASPYQHKSGHYERLGNLQANGEKPDDISAYARKMGQTEFDVVESRHALLQDKKDSRRPVNYGLQHLHEDDTFTHPDTGVTHPISEWEDQGMHIKTPEALRTLGVTDDSSKVLETAEPGVPSLLATKGSNTSIYKDSAGNLQTTVPTHIGWWKTPTDGNTHRRDLNRRPGNWNFRTGVLPLDAKPMTEPVPAYDFTAQQTREAIPVGSKQSRAQIGEAARAMAQIASANGAPAKGRISQTQVTNPTTGRALDEPNTVSIPARPTYKTTSTPAEDSTVYKRSGRGKNVLKDVTHLVSQQMAATVGGGPVNAVGEATRSGDVFTTGSDTTRGRSRGFVPTPVVSNGKDGASAFQPGKTVVAGTAAENRALNEKLRTQEDNTGSAGGRGFGVVDNTKPTEMPSYRVDHVGNPIPNPPTVGRKGDKRLFIQSNVNSRVENPAEPTMTSTEAKKYGRIPLEKSSKFVVQPMLDFGQTEREEENARAIASKANSGIDATTGKKFKRGGQQWGFLDPRWLGSVKDTDTALADSVSQENRAKGSAYPRAERPAPTGLPKTGPKSKPIDTDGAGPAATRILGEMSGSKQIQAQVAYLKGGNPELNDIIEAKRSKKIKPAEALSLAQDAGHLPRTPRVK